VTAVSLDQIYQTSQKMPQYIVVEGPIGVGKTALSKRLAQTFRYQTLLEDADDNPFLTRFYENRQSMALQTQLFFLFQRAKQLQSMRQGDLFEPIRVADFLMEKDRLFARQNLDDDEYLLYEQVYTHLTIDTPKPDLVIYLQAPVDVLQQRIHKRGRAYERYIDNRYLSEINEAYTRFFYFYDDSPLLIVNATEIDFVNNERDYQQLVEFILANQKGRHYFNPVSLRL
jgi:deoxyguanosine kinase